MGLVKKKSKYCRPIVMIERHEMAQCGLCLRAWSLLCILCVPSVSVCHF
jgi:hypothetical protein